MNAVGIDVSKGKSMVAIMFGLTAFVVICVASACANAYRIRREVKRIKDSLRQCDIVE